MKKAQEELDSPEGMIGGVPKWRNVSGSKALQNRHARWTMHEKHNTIVAITMSMNPPVDVMKERFYDVAERKRDPIDQTKSF